MRILTAALAILLAGCASIPQQTNIKPVSAEAVLRQIKKELAQYTSYQQTHAIPSRENAVCKGTVDFVIDSVSISLVTQTEVSADGSASLSVPVGGPGTLGPSMSVSSVNKQSQTINFTIYPVRDVPYQPDAQTRPDSLFVGTPIADALIGFRDSLLKASDQPPCVTFVRPGGGQENSIVYGFAIVQTVHGGVTYRLLVFSAGANSSSQQQNSNVITVKFKDEGKGVHDLLVPT
jgi:hypothetical protein